MHEFSLCDSILTTAVAEFEKLDPRPSGLCRVRVVCGGLHQVVPDYLLEAWRILSKDSPAEGASLDLVVTPVRARCKGCGWEGEIAPPVFACGDCEAFSVEITGGREFYIETLEVTEDEQT